MTRKKHRTSHMAEPDEHGRVLAFCENCKWRVAVDVNGLPYWEAIAAIFKARDAHEAEPDKWLPGPAA